MNHDELNRQEFRGIKEILFGDGKVFDTLSIDKKSIPSIRKFQWTFTGGVYGRLRSLPVSKYITSPQLVYSAVVGADHHRILFHFRFYGRYSESDPQCAIFLEIDEIPEEVRRLRVEIDMKCDKKQKFRQLLRTRVLSKEQKVIGFCTFDHRELQRNEKMDWTFAVKMFNVEKEDVDEEEEYLRELYQIFE